MSEIVLLVEEAPEGDTLDDVRSHGREEAIQA